MQNNITVLNSDIEWKDGVVAKPGNTKYTKAAKLSTHQVFRTKTKEIMDKARTPKEAVAPATLAQASEEVKAPEVANTTEVAQVEPTETAPVEATAPKFLEDDKIVEKVKNLNVTCLPGPLVSTVIGGKKIRVIPDVVAATKHTYQVVGTGEVVTSEVEAKPQPTANEIAPVETSEIAPPQEEVTPQPTLNEEVTTEETAPTFDFGQKLNIGEISEEAVASDDQEIASPDDITTTNVTDKDYKEEKLNNYLNNAGQELEPEISEDNSGKINFKDYYAGIENYKSEIENLDSQIGVAEEKHNNLTEGYNAALIKLKEYKEKLKEEKLSRTMRLKVLDSENADMELAIAMSKRISEDDYQEEDSYDGKGLTA